MFEEERTSSTTLLSSILTCTRRNRFDLDGSTAYPDRWNIGTAFYTDRSAVVSLRRVEHACIQGQVHTRTVRRQYRTINGARYNRDFMFQFANATFKGPLDRSQLPPPAHPSSSSSSSFVVVLTAPPSPPHLLLLRSSFFLFAARTAVRRDYQS